MIHAHPQRLPTVFLLFCRYPKRLAINKLKSEEGRRIKQSEFPKFTRYRRPKLFRIAKALIRMTRYCNPLQYDLMRRRQTSSNVSHLQVDLTQRSRHSDLHDASDHEESNKPSDISLINASIPLSTISKLENTSSKRWHDHSALSQITLVSECHTALDASIRSKRHQVG